LDLATQLQIILLVIMVVVILFEFWLLRRRRKTKYAAKRFVSSSNYRSDSSDDFDEAYNAITSTEKISSILKSQGIDTEEADLSLAQARRAHSRGDSNTALAKANSARVTLMSAKKYSVSTQTSIKPAQDLLKAPVPEEEEEQDYQSRDQTPEAIPAESAPKLPDNYLQSKFMLVTAEDAIKGAEGKGKSVSAAWRSLADARSLFDRAEYGKSLSQALKAKKQAEGIPTAPVTSEEGPAVMDVGAPVTEGVERWKEENPPAAKRPPATEELECPGCKSKVTSDDAFCRKCGGKLEFQLVCPGCGIDIEKSDAFCRKCGTKLTH